MVSILRRGAAIALTLGLAASAQAAGLGKLTVNSALGQILNAEIDLVSLQPGELDNLSARVAAPEAFRDARIEYSPALRLLRFSVEKRSNGNAYLKVTSIAPVNEPFVDALIEVTWPAGRVQREYPILLDPPGYAQGKVTAPSVAAAPAAQPAQTPPAAEPAATPPASATAEPTGTPSATAEMPKGAEPPKTATLETTTGSDTYGPIQKGETLNKIASQVKPSNVSMEQMLVALYRENKSAFAGNMNVMKAGQILKVPSAEDVAKIEQKEANHEVHAQVQDWKGYRENVASAVSSSPAKGEPSNIGSGRIGSAAVAPPPTPAPTSTDVLRLSKSDTNAKAGAPGKGGGGASQDRLNALQEEVTAKDKALREANSRVADLEKQIKDMQKLLDLKGGATAAPAAAPAKVAAAAPTPPPAPAKAPEPAKVEPVPPVTPAKAGAQPEPAKGSAEAPKPAEPPKTAAATDDGKPKPKAAPPKKAPPPPPPKEWYEDLDPLVLGGGAVALIGIPLAAFLFMRRRKSRADAGPNSAMTSAFPSDLKAGGTTAKPAGGLVDTGNSSFLTDFDKTGPGTIDTDEVDPVAEAEVYIAYGRDAQAEEILKEAMARDKNRHEIALKLLEIYHARKSATAFETVAKELHGAVGDASPLWQKAAAMGAQIDPTNPLYAGASGGAATFTSSAPAPKPELDFDIAGKGGAESSAAPTTDFDLGDGGAGGGSSADLNVEQPSNVDFDLENSVKPAAAAPAAEAPKEEKPSFDFDLSGLDFPGSKPAAPAAAPAPSGGGMDLADLNLEMPGSGGGEGGEAVGTKLELAKAYLEIGDKDGAREILNEVAKEGSSAQKEEAQKLIASL